MDARIQAIMAKYDKPEEEEKKQEQIKQPPKTLEDWIENRSLGLRDWPDPLDDNGDLIFTPEAVGLGGLQEIMSDLEQHAPLGIGLIDDVGRQVAELEKKLEFYKSEILSERPKADTDLTPSVMALSPTSIRALSMDHPEEVINKKEKPKQKFGFSDEKSSIMKSVQYTTYPGFFANEMTPLPGQLESPQLLNRVTKAQSFNPAFKKIWKKLFLSEASVAVLQDAFWWFFLDKFQKGDKNAQDGLFSRIADSFVALFFSVPGDYKDNFFKYYPDCLAQALYASYCDVFPRSYNLFDDDFKTDLMNGVYEWITGTRPPPRSWQKWHFKMLEPANIRELQDDRTESLKANMSFDLDATLEAAAAVAPKSVQRPGKRATLAVPWSASKPGFAYLRESHEIGPGPEFERVNFNILGRSPLISHYLRIKELAGPEQGPVKSVGRTECVKLQAPAPTYQEVIRESQRTAKTLSNNFQRILDSSTQESVKIQKQKRTALRKLEKLKKDLVLKNQDIKIISERLLDLMTQPDYASAGYATSALLELPSDDEA